MRKALFALILVAASFVGGAVVNGPGLALVKDAIGLIDVETPSNNPLGPHNSSGPPREVPSIRPSVSFEKSAPSANPESLEHSSRDEPPKPVAAAVSEPFEKLPADSPASAPTPAVVADKPKRDASLVPAIDAGPAASTAVDQGIPERLPIIPRDSIKDWSELRRRLKQAGVTRFETEAELDGRCRFRGFVPMAGKNAVRQVFEAEGDDEFQAAEAALRRLVLWRASEKTDP